MKKLLFALMALFCLCLLCACGNLPDSNVSTPSTEASGEATEDNNVYITCVCGDPIGTQNISYYGGKISIGELSRAHYTYDGLYTAEEGGEQIFDAAGYPQKEVTESVTLYARWIPNEYSICFSAGKGKLDQSQKYLHVYYNQMMETFPVPTLYGYKLKGWQNSSGHLVSDGEIVKDECLFLTSDCYPVTGGSMIVLTAVYEEIIPVVTYDFLSDEHENYTNVYDYGWELRPPVKYFDTATKEFVGWSTSPNEYTPWVSGTELLDSMTLYAFWKDYRSVTMHTGTDAGSQKVRIYADDSFSLSYYTSGLVNNHGIPDGWYASPDYLGEQISAIAYTDTITDYYYKWIPKTYTLVFDTYSAGKEIAPITYTYGDFFDLELLTKTGYTFDGWYTNSSKNGTPIKSIDARNSGSYTLFAGFSKNNYTIRLNAEGGTLSSSTATVKYSDAFKLPVPERKGYTFLGWYTQSVGGDAMTSGNGSSLSNYDYLDGMSLYAHWSFNTSATFFDTNATEVTVYQKSPGFTSFPGVIFDLSSLSLDFNELAARGYKCTVTLSCTLTGVDDCMVYLDIHDGNGDYISGTGWDNKIVESGCSYYVEQPYDFGKEDYLLQSVKFVFKARREGDSLDWKNEYTVSNFSVKLDFYLP